MPKSTTKSVSPTKRKVEEKPLPKEVKLPPLGFGQKQSIFSGGKMQAPTGYVPKTFRVTQHKGG